MRDRALNSVLLFVPAIAGLLLWQLSVGFSPQRAFLMGSPLGILKECTHLVQTGELFKHGAITATEALVGFVGGSVIGTICGLSFWTSKTLRAVARPYLVALGAVPVFALGPVLIFWFGTGIWSKVVLSFLSTLVIAVAQAYAGAADADPNLLRLTKVFGGSKAQQFWKIIVPSAAIWVLAGVRLNIGMALLGAFIGEFIASREGLGHLIIVAEGLYDIDQVWAGIVGIVAIALVFHTATLPIERWAIRWKEQA